MSAKPYVFEDTVGIDTGKANIYGTLIIPDDAWGAVIFAHGSGSSRHNPRHKTVAETLHRVGLATLLVDLLTPAEERVDQFTAQHRFDVELLTSRLIAATDWLETKCSQYDFRIGYFGASTGAAAAFKAAARRHEIAAVVSRGGRPDLAEAEMSPEVGVKGHRLVRPIVAIGNGFLDLCPMDARGLPVCHAPPLCACL